MTTVLVTGAAGNLGRRVIAALAAMEPVEWVLAVDRVPTPATAPKVEAHTIDLSSRSAPDELAALAKQATAIVHLAWKPDSHSNLAVLRHVLAAVEAVEPSQVVHLSSATVYGAWADNPVPLTEESTPRPNPELAYATEKRVAEVMVQSWAAQHPEVAVALLRPACTVGSTEEPLYQALAKSKKPPLGAEERVVQYLHIDDLATAVVHAYEQCLAGTYNVAPDNGVREGIAGALAGGSAVLPLPSSWRANLGDWQWRLLRNGATRGARLRRTFVGDRGGQVASHRVATSVQFRTGAGGDRSASALGRPAHRPTSLGHSRGCRRHSARRRCSRRGLVASAPVTLGGGRGGRSRPQRKVESERLWVGPPAPGRGVANWGWPMRVGRPGSRWPGGRQ